ncbi:hypothetical protein K438DRAFT_260465 [Mycena galopus ATCC 62051]|nr:hypothetical protein K438DRAFT_260465 [Mycena galopus ATCC 62051]
MLYVTNLHSTFHASEVRYLPTPIPECTIDTCLSAFYYGPLPSPRPAPGLWYPRLIPPAFFYPISISQSQATMTHCYARRISR